MYSGYYRWFFRYMLAASRGSVRVWISSKNEMGLITYRIVSFHDTSPKPDGPTSHEITQHDVHKEPVPDDCNLTRMGDSWGILVEKVLDYLLVTSWFLDN